MEGPASVAVRNGRIRVVAESRRQPIIANSVMAMLLFVMMEAMLFAGLISAFAIVRASAILWPPPGQPRLPIEETAINTAALLLSGALLVLSRRRFGRDPRRAQTPLLISILLGAFFVTFQGAEWVALIGQGLTLSSSALGSFFYLIIGMHALHATVALGLLVFTWLRLRRGWLASSQLATAEVFWYFVVGLWPILYLVVYL
jgi:cytochrome c oxidase subunit 3